MQDLNMYPCKSPKESWQYIARKCYFAIKYEKQMFDGIHHRINYCEDIKSVANIVLFVT